MASSGNFVSQAVDSAKNMFSPPPPPENNIVTRTVDTVSNLVTPKEEKKGPFGLWGGKHRNKSKRTKQRRQSRQKKQRRQTKRR